MKKESKKKKSLSDEAFEVLLAKDNSLKETIDAYTKERKEVRALIDEELNNRKLQKEGKHLVFEIGAFKAVRQTKESVKFKPEAVKLFKAKAKNAEKYIVESLDAKLLTAAIKNKDCSETDVEELTEVKTSYSLVIKEVKE